jgi:hypothetical protein
MKSECLSLSVAYPSIEKTWRFRYLNLINKKPHRCSQTKDSLKCPTKALVISNIHRDFTKLTEMKQEKD